jgi:hypothetical protein
MTSSASRAVQCNICFATFGRLLILRGGAKQHEIYPMWSKPGGKQMHFCMMPQRYRNGGW